jgi:flagellar M-ring protein FliF
MWAGKTELTPAFTGLAAEDAAAISEALRSAKVPFEVADAGSTILVPQASLSQARVAAAAAGAGTDGTTGFEIFDRQGFGASEFDQSVTYQRAIEGKLARTIEAMDGIASATVSIVQAEQGLFADRDRPASASVNLRTRSGAPPDSLMVRGIVSTVAGAVAGLTADNVTVVDATGHVLAGPAGSDVTGDAATARASVERTLAAKVQNLVDQVLGPGRASVAVSVDLDMDQVEREVTTVVPINAGNWTPASVQRTEETYRGVDGIASGGIPGAMSNIPGLPTYPGTLPAATGSPAPSGSPASSASPAGGAASAPPSAEAGGYLRQQETVNYANSQVVERIVTASGAIERMSVAVLFDESAAGAITAEGLTSAISAAIGIDETRGDKVSVTAVTFTPKDAAAAPAELLPAETMDTVGGIASAAVGVLGALVLIGLVWRNLRALRARADETELAYLMARPMPLGEGAPSIMLDKPGESDGIAPLRDFDDTPQGRIQERLRGVAREQPEELVGLVNGWLRQDGHS